MTGRERDGDGAPGGVACIEARNDRRARTVLIAAIWAVTAAIIAVPIACSLLGIDATPAVLWIFRYWGRLGFGAVVIGTAIIVFESSRAARRLQRRLNI